LAQFRAPILIRHMHRSSKVHWRDARWRARVVIDKISPNRYRVALNFSKSFGGVMSKGLILVAISLTATAALAGGSSQYERMTAAERREAIRKHPVAFIPAGINEWHGEQSACGLDALKAETLAQVAARTLGG